jgi:hypothetical protein
MKLEGFFMDKDEGMAMIVFLLLFAALMQLVILHIFNLT